jgi:hypothetical protein
MRLTEAWIEPISRKLRKILFDLGQSGFLLYLNPLQITSDSSSRVGINIGKDHNFLLSENL